MGYKLKKNLADKSNYGSSRKAKSIKYIVIHYTANDGDHDESNGNYFHNNKVGASAHYFVDSDSITQSVPDNYIAYAVGGDHRGALGGGSKYKICTNSNSISIELCDDKKNGTIYPSKATIDNAIELTKILMEKYNIPQSHVIRHFDVNGKLCPAYWVKDSLWKKEFWNLLTEDKPSPAPIKKVYSGKFPEVPPNLKKGSKGTQVNRLQKYLNWYGSYGLVADSKFGNATEKAVRDFQKKSRLTVDGIFGKKSLDFAKTVKK